MLKVLGALPVVAFISFQVYAGVIVPRQFDNEMRTAQIEVAKQMERVSYDAADVGYGFLGLGAAKLGVVPPGVDEAKARKEAEAYADRFQPTQNCTYDMLSSSRQQLISLLSGKTMTAQGKYKTWVHLAGIDIYESRNRDKVRAMNRAFGSRDAVSPVECEKYVVGLAIARRG